MRRSSGKSTGEFISPLSHGSAQQEEAGDGEIWKEWELGKGVKNQNGKKIVETKSVERGKMSSEGKRGADKSSKRKASLGEKKKKRIRTREEIEKSSSKLLVFDWEHRFLIFGWAGLISMINCRPEKLIS